MLRADPGGAVDWENYEPGLRAQIQEASAGSDRATHALLRADARAGQKEQIELTGSGNADLIAYLDSQIEAAGCP